MFKALVRIYTDFLFDDAYEGLKNNFLPMFNK